MTLSWQASKDAVSYNVYRAVGDQSTYELVAADVTATTYAMDISLSDRMTLRVTAVGQDARESTGITALYTPG